MIRSLPLAIAAANLIWSICASAEPAVRQAKDFFDPDSATCGIQEAINSLPKEGGRIVLEARTYELRAPIVLRDEVTISGQGRQTVLKRRAEVIRKLSADAKQGESSITVDATAGLRIGDQIAIKDDKHGGWYITHGIITKIDGNSIVIDDRLIKPYAIASNAVVYNHHPMISAHRIWGHRHRVRGWVIEDITIEGNLAENPTRIADWTSAAIHLATTADGVVQRCIVRNFVTDGISDQDGRFNVIRDCVVEGCRGNGFHPGTSVRGSRFINNIARDNEGDGLFFCAEVTAIQVSNNTFVNNRKNGIGGIGGGGDRFNVISGNICFGNALHGIQAENGAGNTITGNICFDNSTSQPGKFAGIALESATEVTVTGNICGNRIEKDKPATQGYGILETGASNRNVITGNIVRDNSAGGIIRIGADSIVSGNVMTPADPR